MWPSLVHRTDTTSPFSWLLLSSPSLSSLPEISLSKNNYSIVKKWSRGKKKLPCVLITYMAFERMKNAIIPTISSDQNIHTNRNYLNHKPEKRLEVHKCTYTNTTWQKTCKGGGTIMASNKCSTNIFLVQSKKRIFFCH